jgi:hypothetical protein
MTRAKGRDSASFPTLSEPQVVDSESARAFSPLQELRPCFRRPGFRRIRPRGNHGGMYQTTRSSRRETRAGGDRGEAEPQLGDRLGVDLGHAGPLTWRSLPLLHRQLFVIVECGGRYVPLAGKLLDGACEKTSISLLRSRVSQGISVKGSTVWRRLDLKPRLPDEATTRCTCSGPLDSLANRLTEASSSN